MTADGERGGAAGFARAAVLLLGALLALALSLYFALDGAAAAPTAPGDAGASDAPSPQPPSPVVEDQQREPVAPSSSATPPAQSVPVPQPDAALALTGIVVDADAQPIAGAEVVAVEELGAGFNMLAGSRQAEQRARQTSGVDGRFSLVVPFARRLSLRVRAAAFAPEVVEPCYAGEDHTVVLHRGATLVGRVSDAATGDPVGDAALEAWVEGRRGAQIEGVSAADGTFRFEGLPAGTLVLDVMPRAHEAQLRREVELWQGETARLDVELLRGGAVFGTVTDAASGLPIPGAEISAGWTFEKVVRVDAAGNYRMQGAPGPGVPDMHARAVGYARASAPVGDEAEQRIDFALRRAGSVRGRVVDADGAAQAGIYVAADADLGVNRGIGHSDWQHTRSGGDGMFRIQGLVPGAQYMLFLRHRGRATKAFHLPGTIDPDRELDVGDLVLEAPAVLLGRVVDQEGRGLADVGVELRGTFDDCERMLSVDERGKRSAPYHAVSRDARTDADGVFRFADLAAGTYDLSANVRGGPRGESGDLRVDAGRTTAGVEIVIDLGAVLAGNVATEDGAPLPQHVSVRIHSGGVDGPMNRWVTVGRDGAFRALGLDDGRYHLQVDVAQWANDEPAPWIGSQLEDVAAGREDVRLVLHPAVFISGRVVDVQGRPQKGIAVVAVQTGADREVARDGTDEAGIFRLRVRRDAVVDLRYGEAPESMHGLVLDPRPESVKSYPGVRAGATGLVLELR